MNLPTTLTFTLTPAQWEVVRARFLEESSIEVPDETSGEILSHGVKCRFTYDGVTLLLTVTDKPWYAPTETVIERITQFINNA